MNTRPYPNADDRAKAAVLVAERYADAPPQWLADRIDRLTSYFADCFMQKRMDDEHRNKLAARLNPASECGPGEPCEKSPNQSERKAA